MSFLHVSAWRPSHQPQRTKDTARFMCIWWVMIKFHFYSIQTVSLSTTIGYMDDNSHRWQTAWLSGRRNEKESIIVQQPNNYISIGINAITELFTYTNHTTMNACPFRLHSTKWWKIASFVYFRKFIQSLVSSLVNTNNSTHSVWKENLLGTMPESQTRTHEHTVQCWRN